MSTFSVRFTETASQSIEDQVHHLAVYLGTEAALNQIVALVDTITSRLAGAPLAYPSSQQASELGILQYREFNTHGSSTKSSQRITPSQSSWFCGKRKVSNRR